MEVSPFDQNTIYYGSQYLHRSRDGGVNVGEDLARHDGASAGNAGRERRTDHARCHGRRGVQHALYDPRIARAARRDLDGLERRPGLCDARRRQDLDQRHAEGHAAGRAHPEHRAQPAAAGNGLFRGVPLPARRFRAIHLPHRRFRQDVDEADRRQERHRGRRADARGARRSRARRACSTPEPNSACIFRSTTARTGNRSR